MAKRKAIVPVERIEKAILLIRGEKVLLDRHLAELYGVETRMLNQAVRRNIKRFPKDFMFELTRDEIMRISQTVTSSQIKYSKRVHAFTEQGVAMLSSVLNSERAIEVNIAIMRAFVKLREMLGAHKDLRRKLAALEKKYDDQFKIVFEAIAELMTPPEKSRRKIGFDIKEPRPAYGGKRKRTSQSK
jgi:ribosomal protein S13